MKFSTCTLFAALLLAQTRMAEAKAYKGAEVYSLQPFLYGRMEIRMQMIRGSGLVSTFFTYKNGSEIAGTAWEETDIEALGKNDAKTWQSNLITGNPRMTSEQLYSATSSLADGYHTYTLEWTPDYVSWAFDGVMVRKTEGGQASSLINPETLRFNAWASDAAGWAGALDGAALPAYQFVNWIKYYRYENGQFVLDWTDDFDSFDSSRWGAGNWTFDGNLVDFDPANAVAQDGTLILAITTEGATGFSGTVPVDDGSSGGVIITKSSDSGCTVGGSQSYGAGGPFAMLIVLGVAAWRRRHLGAGTRMRHARPALKLAALLLGILVPRAASAVQSAELFRTTASFYGRFEARIRFAPGEGVVSSFFLWKDGSSSTTSWNELDFEKINSTCRLQTNIWTGKGTQSSAINTPTFDICADYHNYGFEWTPDYIAWYIDGAQIRKVTGASVTEYTQNASQGMAMHFNIWVGNSGFGGTLNPSILPVYQYISWVQYSSYANGAFQQQWREEFNASTTPTGFDTGTWASVYNLSTHNRANVVYKNGIAVLAMTADNATGYSGTPPMDTSATGTGGAPGTGGVGTSTGSGGRAGTGGAPGGGGRGGNGGSSLPGTGGTSPTGGGGSSGVAGSPGDGAGGASAGAGGTGVVDPSGSGGASATGVGGAAATGGASGTGGGEAGAGCGCRAAGGGTTGDGGVIALLLIATCVRLRRSRIVTRSPHR